MKTLLALLAGALVALAIACGGGSKATTPLPPDPGPGPGSDPGGDPREQLIGLDQEITDAMQKLGEPRPAPPVTACVENCARPMSTAAAAATKDAPTCQPGASETCKSTCDLKDSICKNASRICSIASDLGGNDAYANETCNRGLASCETSKKRCCSCL